MKKKLLVLLMILTLSIATLCGTTVFASAATTSTNAPYRAASQWTYLGSIPEEKYKYDVYRSNTQTKEERVGEYVKALVDVNEATVNFSYTATESTTHTINFETEVTVSGKAGFIACGTFSVSAYFNLSKDWTSGKGVTFSRTLINDTNNPAGIYQLNVYTIKRKYSVDVYEANIVEKTKTYQTKEGKNTVTKTEKYTEQDGWKYCGTYETYFMDVDRNGKTIQTVKVERIANLPTIVG